MRSYLFSALDVAGSFTAPKVVWRDLLENQTTVRGLRGGGYGCGQLNPLDVWEDMRVKERTHLIPWWFPINVR
jgi:hypothetical protein